MVAFLCYAAIAIIIVVWSAFATECCERGMVLPQFFSVWAVLALCGYLLDLAGQ